jgi:GLPGLI family protein
MKTKNTLLVLAVLLLLSTTLSFGQTPFQLDPKTSTFIDKAQVECIYQYTVNAPLKNNQANEKQLETYNTILQVNGSVSKFWDCNAFKKDSIIYSSAKQLSTDSLKKVKGKYLSAKCLFLPVILKNYPKEKITVTDEITPDDYIYTENKTERNWILKDDTLTVCGYLCNKAVASFGGRKWTAWYAPEITISDGPWKLYGLPGLILKAEDSTGTHSFETMAIRQSDRPIYVAKNILQMKTVKEQFIKNKNKFEEDPEKNLPFSQIKSVDVLKKEGVILINGKRSSMMSKTLYCPLELE